MRILNQDDDKPIEGVLIMLTPFEAKQLSDFLSQLTPDAGDHLHVNDETFMKEITIAIYTSENTHTFSRRVIDLIEKEV